MGGDCHYQPIFIHMVNTDHDFYGKQEDEKILYVVHPHPFAITFGLIKIYIVALIMVIALIILGSVVSVAAGIFMTIALILFLVVILGGSKIVLDWQSRNIAYITDRRIVRFEPTTLFATNSRSLTWDEVVKVKTYPPNFLWKQMAIGNVTIHSRTPEQGPNADDITLMDVFYYKDLGNYIDKILFTYKQKPREIADIHPFVPKPRGQRY